MATMLDRPAKNDTLTSRGQAACKGAEPSLRVVSKTELHADLIVPNAAANDVPLDLSDLEPFEISQRSRRHSDALLDRIFDAGLGCPDDLGKAVDVIVHLWSPFEVRGDLSRE